MKKVLIIEDERISAIRLEKLIREIDDTIEVEGPLVSVSEVVEHLPVSYTHLTLPTIA